MKDESLGYLTNCEQLKNVLKSEPSGHIGEHVIQAVTKQLERDGRLERGFPGSLCSVDENDYAGRWEDIYWDDSSGKPLPAEEVHRARYEELEYIRTHKVYEKVTLEQCWERTGRKPIPVRWVDINKGDAVNPDIPIEVGS